MLSGSKNRAPQPQRNARSSRGTDAQAMRGLKAKNKDHLGSDRDRTMSAKPGANLDEFGSRHNADNRKSAQYKKGREGGFANLSFRESSQDTRKPNSRARIKQEGARGQKRTSRNHG